VSNSRAFLQKNYPVLKKNNPNTPILIREAAGVQPVVYARFGKVLNSLLES
jgi:NADH dehydrogenase (ubiquinone) 1 alpha subcomplex subunit 2